jgi:hypothetical protein
MENVFLPTIYDRIEANIDGKHMAEELKRKQSETVIIALHPGEVMT